MNPDYATVTACRNSRADMLDKFRVLEHAATTGYFPPDFLASVEAFETSVKAYVVNVLRLSVPDQRPANLAAVPRQHAGNLGKRIRGKARPDQWEILPKVTTTKPAPNVTITTIRR